MKNNDQFVAIDLINLFNKLIDYNEDEKIWAAIESLAKKIDQIEWRIAQIEKKIGISKINSNG
ncbi:hypothetical protein A7K93_09155 [Candidatus Methylacidiphilum fumarolicum]|uniref:Uncharacterized protein n=2 Tax=Candidatus Methylacidiphilum fumarolicum TaxID=591154 RepID=I0JZG5_METFB|nr:hypothetical protein [Candidatus Methylacidiphilum fumarolicum]MBW6415762.1 hypothetical protein [Candidatus Methylacidiphilum fumarolicum]TFE66844.1 hypothetical protein A7K73_09830 [Candidatus Methylacidiphilum fumarolicum]TFE72259.1 hypothetical protein A7K93_09155 [Candidatus Methylacidiphilum fumarolicum]TFE72502.1 hypothetical protein A7K72_08600 [Candidatus Methylacidiphilum fumarolicum]TFE77673.1 hypothetical protein A7D33_03730 [Candidatus Methylacidiphilum fumarolicum]